MLEKEWKELEIIGDGDVRIDRAMSILDDATEAVKKILGKQAHTEISLRWKTDRDNIYNEDIETRHTEHFAY